MDNEFGAEKKSAGPLIGFIVIIAIIVLGGLYFWGQRAEPTETPDVDNSVQSTSTVESDEITDIEGDLETTDVEGLDADLGTIEGEVGTSTGTSTGN